MEKDSSYMAQLVLYIKKNIAKGYPAESLKWALLSQGYSRGEIGRAITRANQDMAKEVPILKEKPIIKIETIPVIEDKTNWLSKLKNWFS